VLFLSSRVHPGRGKHLSEDRCHSRNDLPLGRAAAEVQEGKRPRPPPIRWTFDGQTLEPVRGETLENTYRWDGEELAPVTGANPERIHKWDGRRLEPKRGSTFRLTWVFDGDTWERERGSSAEDTWTVEGTVPVPVAAVVILGIARP
jgi:hypothetical protein